MLEDQEQSLCLFSFFLFRKSPDKQKKKVKVTNIPPLLCVSGTLGIYAKERDTVSEKVCYARRPQCCLCFVCVRAVFCLCNNC